MDAELRDLIFDEDFNIRDVSEEALYNSLLGAASAVVFNAPDAAWEYVTQARTSKAQLAESEIPQSIAETDVVFERSVNEESQIRLPDIKYPGDDPSAPPGEGFVWRGKEPPSDGFGAWYNPKTDVSFHWDLNHANPIGPHWDYTDSDGNVFRVYKDGRIELSKKGGKKSGKTFK